jgi:hypothetical protein
MANNVSANNLTSLYGGGGNTVSLATVAVPTVDSSIASRNLTTLYSSAGAPVIPTGPYGNANVERFLNAGTDGGNNVTNINMGGDLTVGGESNLGVVSNVHITGGQLNYILTTDGGGGLSWNSPPTTIPSIIPFIHFDVIANGNNQQFTDANLSFYSSNVQYVNLMKNGVNIDPTNFQFINATTIQVDTLLETGDSVDILATGSGGGNLGPGGNVYEVQYNDGLGGFAGNSSFTFFQANSTLTVGNLVIPGTSDLGDVSNVVITGGTANYVLSTDGAGNLSWTAQSGGGNGNITVQDEGSNIVITDIINFVGAGVTVSNVANIATITIPGGGGGGNTSWANIVNRTGANAPESIAIGENTADNPGYNNVLIGANANAGYGGVSIGADAGNNNQGGSATAVGFAAGKNNQGAGATALGNPAGLFDQGPYAIAIGAAGISSQGQSSIAIGNNAAIYQQGSNSIAIGFSSGAGPTSTSPQATNSIVLNASGGNLNANIANTFVVKPVRNANTANVMFYDSTSGEITYDSSNAITSVGNLVYLNIRDDSNANSVITQFASNSLPIWTNANSNAAYRVTTQYWPNASTNYPTESFVRSRGNATTPTTAVSGDRVAQNRYFVYNGNANVGIGNETWTLVAGGTLSNLANQVYAGSQWNITTVNPASGDLANASANSPLNALTFNNSGGLTITPGAAPNTSLGQATSSVNITSFGQSTANLVRVGGLNFQRARGNRDSFQSVQANDIVGTSFFIAYSNGAFQSSNVAQYRVVVDSTYVANDVIVPLSHQFQTVANVANVATFRTTSFYANGLASFPGDIVTTGTANLGILNVTGNISTTGTTSIQQAKEKVSNVSASTGTVNFDVLTSAINLTSANATANYTLNIRGNSSVTFDSISNVGDSYSITYVNKNGATAYTSTSITIDGTSVSPIWANGSPYLGGVNAYDVYNFNIIKTAVTPTYIVFLSSGGYA